MKPYPKRKDVREELESINTESIENISETKGDDQEEIEGAIENK